MTLEFEVISTSLTFSSEMSYLRLVTEAKTCVQYVQLYCFAYSKGFSVIIHSINEENLC